MMTILDSVRFTRDGFDWAIYTIADESSGPPWKESDGFGIVSDWERRAKRPGEVIIADDRGSRIFYDIAGTQRIAVRDGWTIADPSGLTRRAAAAAAVRANVERCRAWVSGDWGYVGVRVTRSRIVGRETCTVDASLWGIESDAVEYLAEVAEELMHECME